MSNEKEDGDRKAEVVDARKEKPKKELTPQEIQKRKKMLVYPLLGLLFIASMWLIFAPSGDKDAPQTDGFNSELPIPKDEGIVEDKRTAYEQEAVKNKQQEKMRSLQDFAFTLGEDAQSQQEDVTNLTNDNQESLNNRGNFRSNPTIQSSATAYQNVNRQLNSWNVEPDVTTVKQTNDKMESRIVELEKQLEAKSQTDQQLELIEKSYAIAAKYMPNQQAEQVKTEEKAISLKEKVVPKPVSQVHQKVVSLLAAPMENEEFLKQYGKPRNMGFLTVAGSETESDKNSIRASVYQTVTISNGKELQLRILEPMRAGNILIPANTVLTGSAKIGGERLHITISSIQFADNIIPVEMEVYDMDGMQGIFIPNSDEMNAVKEIVANMGTSTGSSISITDNAGSQLAADLSRSAIQGVSQFFSKKMREVKVTLKAGYKVLLIPKAQ